MSETKATETKTATPATICQCGTVKVGKNAFERGDCQATTKKSFAQGHDAKMSARVATEIALGEVTMDEGLAEIRRAGGGINLVEKTKWSAGLRAKKLAAKARKGQPNAKTEAEEYAATVTGDEDAQVTKIKVGRWEYDATIDDKGDAHYTNARGEEHTAVSGTYKLVK